MALDHRDGACVLHDAVGLRRIDLDDVVAVRTQPAKTNEIFHVLRRKKIFSGRERGIIRVGDLREQGKIERIAWLLEPAQPERRERLGVCEGFLAAELGVGIDRELRMRGQDRLDGFYSAHVLGERETSDLHFHHRVTGVEMATHLVLQIFDGLARGVPTAANVAEDLGGGLTVIVTLGKHAVERFAGDLRDCIPNGDFDRADCDRALAVTTGFFPLHHDSENFCGIEVLLCLVEEAARISGEDARDEARAHRRAAGIAAGRVEGETDHGLAIAHHIGDDRHDRGRHFGKIEARIPDVRLERDRALADVDDTHLGFIPGDSCYSAARKLERFYSAQSSVCTAAKGRLGC